MFMDMDVLLKLRTDSFEQMNPHLDATLACLDRHLELAKVVCEMVSTVGTSSAVLSLSSFARAASSNRQFDSMLMLRSATAAASLLLARAFTDA